MDQVFKKNCYIHKYLPIIARVLIASAFIATAVVQYTVFKENGLELFRQYAWAIDSVHFLKQTDLFKLFFKTTILINLIGGVLLLVGYRPKITVPILIIFTAVMTLAFNRFWQHGHEVGVYGSNMIFFFKNLSLLGALLLFMFNGAPKEGGLKQGE